MENIREQIGRQMSLARKRRGITRTAIAEQLDVSDVAVYYWETGRNPIDVDRLKAYCDILNIDWIEMLKYATKKDEQ